MAAYLKNIYIYKEATQSDDNEQTTQTLINLLFNSDFLHHLEGYKKVIGPSFGTAHSNDFFHRRTKKKPRSLEL
jgi:hypothetical protein